MNAPKTRRTAAAAVLLAPALASCGTNFGAQTDQVYIPADGVNNRDGQVDVLNALVVSAEPGSGRVIATLVNNSDEPDELVSVAGAEEDAGVQVTVGEGDTEIPEEGSLRLHVDEAALLEASGDEEQLRTGAFVRLTFTFETAEPATVNVPVVAPDAYYSDIELPGGSTGTDSEDGGLSDEPTTDTETESPEG